MPLEMGSIAMQLSQMHYSNEEGIKSIKGIRANKGKI